MPLKHLTQRAVEALKTDEGQMDVLDTSIRLRRGMTFGVRVTQTGRKEFFCRYRDRTNRRRRLSLGDAAQVSLAEAHEKLRTVAARLDQGRDASEERDAHDASITFTVLCQEFIRLHAARKKDGGKEYTRIIERTLIPAWGTMKACEVRRRDVAALLDEIGVEQGKPIAANKTRTVLSSIFSFGLRRELVEMTPCLGLPQKFPEGSRDRFLTDEEIITFWQATRQEPPVIRDLFRLLLLLGQRSGEIKAMQWSELRDGVWYIPAPRTKNNKEQVVPLPPFVISLLEPHRKSGQVSVFIARGDASIKWIQKAKCRIAAQMKGVPPWTAHDLRRTCASGMEKLGVPEAVIGSVLNHSKESRHGVTAVYARHRYLKEKASALKLWCDHVLRLAMTAESEGKSTNQCTSTEEDNILEIYDKSQHGGN